MSSSMFWRLICLCLLVTLALSRFLVIDDNSITQDESTMILFAQGVLEKGYPFIRQVHDEFLISTYELVPYPIALAIAAMGFSETSVRLPSLFFALGTALLMLRFSTALFDRRVAFIAVALFTVLPWAIYWGSNAFYPSQVQFFALLTAMAIYRLISRETPETGVYYGILLAFSLSYLSWEGAGFLLPVFFMTILFMRWGRWQWLQNSHAWIAATLIILVVIGQLTYRTVLREPFLGVSTGRSEVSFATLAFTQVGFDPLYYPRELITEAHLLIPVFLAFGLVFLRESPQLRYLYFVIFLTLAVLTGLLGYYALRYFYLALPMVLMAVAAVTVMLADRIAESVWLPSRRWFSGTALAMLFALHLSIATPWGLEPTEASEKFQAVRANELTHDMSGFPFHDMTKALLERYQAGDLIIVQAPFPFQVYSGLRGDYFLQNVTATSVYYVEGGGPYYTDKWVGNPVLRNRDELDEVLYCNRRVWFVSAPDGASRTSVGTEIYQYVTQRMRLVTENSSGRLYLWQRPPELACSMRWKPTDGSGAAL